MLAIITSIVVIIAIVVTEIVIQTSKQQVYSLGSFLSKK